MKDLFVKKGLTNNQIERFRIKSGMTILRDLYQFVMKAKNNVCKKKESKTMTNNKNVKNLFTYLPIHLFTPKITGLLRRKAPCNNVNHLSTYTLINLSTYKRKDCTTMKNNNNVKNLFTYLPIHLFTPKITGLLRRKAPRNDVILLMPQCLSNLVSLPQDPTPKSKISTLPQGAGIPVTHLFTPKKKAAFTLAEVLITLGIIGVVAAMTIPNLMSNYKKHEVSVRLKNFYSTVKQAERLANDEYGTPADWDTSMDSEAFLKQYYLPYISGAQIFPDLNVDAKYCLELLNGSAFCYSTSSVIFYPYANDVRTKTREQLIHGKSYFTFVFYTGTHSYYESKTNYCSGNNYLGIDAYTYAWKREGCTREGLISNSNFGCNNPKGDSAKLNAFCTQLIKDNGWEIPKDYPVRF